MGASFGILLFFMTITGGFFWASITKRTYGKNLFLNLLLKRLSLIIGIYMITFTAGVAITIAANANMGLFNEIFFIVWLFGWAGYATMVLVFFKTLVDAMKMWKTMKMDIRTGNEE